MAISIAVLGTGRMGYPLVLRLIELGHSLKVFNRTYPKAAPLLEHGADVLREPALAIRDVELIIMAVSTAEVADQLLDSIVDPNVLRGKTLMVLSTSSSSQSMALSERAKGRGLAFLETPVMGGPTQALEGTLIMMVGADESAWLEWKPILQTVAQKVYWTGPIGSASVLKLALNQFMASSVAALATSLALVQAAEVPVDLLIDILKRFPYYSPSFDSKLPLMLAGEYENPKFTIDMMGKDVGLMVDEALLRGVYPDNLQAIATLYRASSAAGCGEKDYSAIFEMVKP